MKEHTSGGVVELTAVITLNGFDGGPKLSGNIRKKLERQGKVSDLRRKGKVQE
jgi:hypothetical protein